MVVLSLTVKVPRHLPLGITESLEKGIAEAVQILAGSSALEDISESAYNLARLVVTQVRPGGIMLEERINCQDLSGYTRVSRTIQGVFPAIP